MEQKLQVVENTNDGLTGKTRGRQPAKFFSVQYLRLRKHYKAHRKHEKHENVT